METPHETRLDTKVALQQIGDSYLQGDLPVDLVVKEAKWLFDDKNEMVKYLNNLGISLEI